MPGCRPRGFANWSASRNGHGGGGRRKRKPGCRRKGRGRRRPVTRTATASGTSRRSMPRGGIGRSGLSPATTAISSLPRPCCGSWTRKDCCSKPTTSASDASSRRRGRQRSRTRRPPRCRPGSSTSPSSRPPRAAPGESRDASITGRNTNSDGTGPRPRTNTTRSPLSSSLSPKQSVCSTGRACWNISPTPPPARPSRSRS